MCIRDRLNDIESVGPILMGMDRAVHIVQLGARVDEMVNMTTIAVVDAQEREKKKRKEKSMIGTSDKNG